MSYKHHHAGGNVPDRSEYTIFFAHMEDAPEALKKEFLLYGYREDQYRSIYCHRSMAKVKLPETATVYSSVFEIINNDVWGSILNVLVEERVEKETRIAKINSFLGCFDSSYTVRECESFFEVIIESPYSDNKICCCTYKYDQIVSGEISPESVKEELANKLVKQEQEYQERIAQIKARTEKNQFDLNSNNLSDYYYLDERGYIKVKESCPWAKSHKWYFYRDLADLSKENTKQKWLNSQIDEEIKILKGKPLTPKVRERIKNLEAAKFLI